MWNSRKEAFVTFLSISKDLLIILGVIVIRVPLEIINKILVKSKNHK